MTKDDLLTNALSGGAIALTFANIETVLTMLVLATALIYNVVKIYKVSKKGPNPD